MVNGDIDGADEIIKTCIVTNHAKNVYIAALGEEEIQTMKDNGFVFEE